MFNQTIKLAQADDPILNNLAQDDQKMVELNNEVNGLLSDFSNGDLTNTSFFNFSNPFFLLTLIGLILLAFGLWFLHQELKHPSGSPVKVKHKKPEPVKEVKKPVEKKAESPVFDSEVAQTRGERGRREEPKPELPKPKPAKKKKVKIPVVKVK